jgi:hypothetical protein
MLEKLKTMERDIPERVGWVTLFQGTNYDI